MKVYCLKGLTGFLENQESTSITLKANTNDAITMYDSMSKCSIFIEENGKFTTGSGNDIVVSNENGFMNSIELLEKGVLVTIFHSRRDIRSWFPKGKVSDAIIKQATDDGILKNVFDIEEPVVKKQQTEENVVKNDSKQTFERLVNLHKKFDSLIKESEELKLEKDSKEKAIKLLNNLGELKKIELELLDILPKEEKKKKRPLTC